VFVEVVVHDAFVSALGPWRRERPEPPRFKKYIALILSGVGAYPAQKRRSYN
jgi:hypothetical protein